MHNSVYSPVFYRKRQGSLILSTKRLAFQPDDDHGQIMELAWGDIGSASIQTKSNSAAQQQHQLKLQVTSSGDGKPIVSLFFATAQALEQAHSDVRVRCLAWQAQQMEQEDDKYAHLADHIQEQQQQHQQQQKSACPTKNKPKKKPAVPPYPAYVTASMRKEGDDMNDMEHDITSELTGYVFPADISPIKKHQPQQARVRRASYHAAPTHSPSSSSPGPPRRNVHSVHEANPDDVSYVLGMQPPKTQQPQQRQAVGGMSIQHDPSNDQIVVNRTTPSGRETRVVLDFQQFDHTKTIAVTSTRNRVPRTAASTEPPPTASTTTFWEDDDDDKDEHKAYVDQDGEVNRIPKNAATNKPKRRASTGTEQQQPSKKNSKQQQGRRHSVDGGGADLTSMSSSSRRRPERRRRHSQGSATGDQKQQKLGKSNESSSSTGQRRRHSNGGASVERQSSSKKSQGPRHRKRPSDGSNTDQPLPPSRRKHDSDSDESWDEEHQQQQTKPHNSNMATAANENAPTSSPAAAAPKRRTKICGLEVTPICLAGVSCAACCCFLMCVVLPTVLVLVFTVILPASTIAPTPAPTAVLHDDFYAPTNVGHDDAFSTPAS